MPGAPRSLMSCRFARTWGEVGGTGGGKTGAGGERDSEGYCCGSPGWFRTWPTAIS